MTWDEHNANSNSSGGLGLTGGIVDVGGLFDCLRGIHANLASPSILDIYADVRVQRWRDIVNPVSSANIKRLFAQDPETALADDPFLQACARAESDLEFSRQLQTGTSALEYDFTQHYEKGDAMAAGDATNGLGKSFVRDAVELVPPEAT